MNNIFVVVRSVGELTTNICYSIVAEQVGKDNVVVIQEKPHSQAVCKTFELGIASGKEWTLAVDADILIRKNGIKDLVEWAEKKEDYFFEFEGRIMDKLYHAPRQGGPHLYRTKYLDKVLGVLSKEKNILRAESFTYNKMAEMGIHYYHNAEVYGIHDYSQYYSDIYRKAFFHAYKHNNVTAYFMKQWMKFKNVDPDYNIAIKGYIDGLCSTDDIEVNIDFFKKQIEKNLPELIEKKSVDENIQYRIDEIIQSWKTDSDSIDFEKRLVKEVRSDKMYDAKEKKQYSLIGKMGSLFIKIGHKLHQIDKQ